MNDENEGRYRSKYLQLLEEVDAKEQQWEQVDQRVRRILTHLLIVAEGPGSAEISAELAEIRDQLKGGLDLAAVETRVEALRQRILGESRWAETPPPFPPLHQILIHLVERLPLPSELSEATVDAIESLEAGIAPDGLPDAIDRVSGLVRQARLMVQDEKRELEALLQEITGQLSELDRGIVRTRQGAESSLESNRTLEDAVSSDMRGLEADTRGARDLDTLRHHVFRAIESIRAHMEAKRREDATQAVALSNEVDQLHATIGLLEQEVTEYREKTRQAREDSLRDPLTGCNNRLAYQERVQTEEARWKRYHTPLAVILFDVDHFKSINDTFGHRAGDQVLKTIAQLSASQLRASDFFARYGGEEFVALLPETELDAALQAAEKVRSAVAAFRFHSRGKRIPLTLSAGVAQLHGDDSVATALERADQALYRAKQGGRNRCQSEA